MAGPVRIAILANGAQARREFAQTSSAMTRMGGIAKKAVAGGLLLGGAALVKFGIDAVNAERQFSTSMRLIQAATKASEAEMDELNKLAIKLGADTSFSASEAADAMLELAKAGLDTKTIMGGGLAGTLTLAAAGGTDLATASTIASNALNTFNLSGKQMESVAAALAGGANASTASVESLGQALQQVGPGATNAGLSLQETVAALSSFDAAGIKGSDAGTSLKTMLARLVPSTNQAQKAMQQLGLDFVKGNGEFESLTNIAGQLQDRLGGLSSAQRQAALQTIFGSDASRAATVLMREGESGIRDFIKATRDQDAAQEMAAARMSGTEGALEKLSGAYETAKLRVGQELAPAIEAGANALSDKLVPAIETGIDAAKDIGNALAPAVEEIAEALGNMGGEGSAVGKVFNNVFIPALTGASEIVGGLVNVVDELPGPIKEIGVQAGIAAVVLPRLTGAITAGTGAIQSQITYLRVLKLEMQDTAGRSRLAATAMGKLGGAASTAAGIGGMVALTQSSEIANRELGLLVSAAGGAATGFAVGGPWGAAIGGAAGLLLGLTTQTDSSKSSMEGAITVAGDYAASLDEVSGAATRATRAEAARALQEQDALALGRELGLSSRDLVSATLGQEGALKRVNKVFMDQLGTSTLTVDAYGNIVQKTGVMSKEAYKLAGILGIETDALTENQRKTRELSVASGELTRSLKGVKGNSKIVTRIERKGWPEAERGIARVTRGLNLTPKQIRTVMDVLGVDGSVKKVRQLIARMDDAKKPRRGRVEVDGTPANRTLAGVDKALAQVTGKRREAKVGVDDKPARSNASALDRYLKELTGRNREAKINAPVPYSDIITINQALNAIPDENVTVWITRRNRNAGPASATTSSAPFGDPFATAAGYEEAAGKDAVARLLKGMKDGAAGARKTIQGINDLIRDQIDLKDEKREKERERRIIASLGKRYNALLKIGRAQDANNRKLDQAQQNLEKVRDWANQVKQSFIETGSITNLGTLEDGTVSSDLLLDQLRQEASQAKRFSALIRQLSDGKGVALNKTTLQQLIAAGPEAGLATAEALIAGGDAALKEINSLTGNLAATGASLGRDMSDEFFKVGLDAAEGLVKGLEGKSKKLDRAARKLANKLAKEVRKALGIKSPSTVFAGIGDNVIKGLEIGLDDTYAKKSAVRLSDALTEGFGTPALDAYVKGGSQKQAAPSVRVRLSAEQVSQLQRGREIQMDLDAYQSAGGRRKA